MTAPLQLRSPIVDDQRRMAGHFSRFLYQFWSALGFSDDGKAFAGLPLRRVGGRLSTLTGNLKAVSCSASGATSIRFTGRLPNDYREGTPIYPYVAWAPSNTDTGNCRWQMRYWIGGSGDTISQTEHDAKDDAAGGTALVCQTTQMDAVSGTSFKKGDSVVITLQRRGASDTFTGVAYMLEFGIKYQRRGVGTPKAFPEG